MAGIYGEYGESWTCPNCGYENDGREFCEECRTQAPQRVRRAAGVAGAAGAAPAGGRRARARMSASWIVGAVVLIGLVAAGAVAAKAWVDRRQRHDDQARAARLVVQQADLPPGWVLVPPLSRVAPPRPGTADGSLAGCVGIQPSSSSDPPKAESSFASSPAVVNSEVLVVSNSATAANALHAVRTTLFRTCLQQALQHDPATGQPIAGLTGVTATITAEPSPGLGVDAVAYRLAVTTAGHPPVLGDVVFLRQGRSLAFIFFLGPSPPGDALRQQVVSNVAARMLAP